MEEERPHVLEYRAGDARQPHRRLRTAWTLVLVIYCVALAAVIAACVFLSRE